MNERVHKEAHVLIGLQASPLQECPFTHHSLISSVLSRIDAHLLMQIFKEKIHWLCLTENVLNWCGGDVALWYSASLDSIPSTVKSINKTITFFN